MLQIVAMSIFSDNIRYLRAQLNISQQAVADSLKITRGRYAKYEDAANEPPLDILLKISRFYKLSIDLLITVDVRKYPLDRILTLPDNRIVLPITVDAAGDNKIEIIPHKASMGYLNGYSDPEYIESLQSMSLPFLRNGNYRAFPVAGDSMPPFNDGTFIVGKYVESIANLKKNRTYIFITRDEGITYKRFKQYNDGYITVSPDNDFYDDYTIRNSEIVEMWEYACSINTKELKESKSEELTTKEVYRLLKKEIDSLKALLHKSTSK